MRRPAAIGIIVAATLVGLGLRLWNASAAYHHDDEKHYAGDGAWATSLPPDQWLAFLRDHPHPHQRLVPDQERIAHWGEPGTIRHLGHPALYATLLGPVFGLTGATDIRSKVLAARVLNAVLDTVVIPVTALAALALGTGPGAALGAATLYAVYPPAVTFGSLAYPEAPLALGIVLLLVLTSVPTVRRALAAGAVAGLMVATKATGLLAPAYAASLLLRQARHWRRAVLALVASAVVAAALVNPLRYAQEVIDPLDPATAVRSNIVSNMRSTAIYATAFSHYYWLGFGQHGRPLALPMARAHRVLTPVYLSALVLAVAATLFARRWWMAVACLAPIVTVLALAPVFNGMWRLHLCTPLMCLLIASAFAGAGRSLRAAGVLVALLVAVQPFLPLRPDATGTIALHEVLFANSSEGQSHNLFNPIKRRLFFVALDPEHVLTRRLWLQPGSYRVAAKAEGRPLIRLDGTPVPLDAASSAVVEVTDHLHQLELGSEEMAKLFELRITRL